MASGITCLGACQGEHPYHQGRCHEVEQGERCPCEVAL